jgi:nitrile hydratase
MNGGQDLGGAQGHGPVIPEPNEPVFHAEWEKRAFALTLAMGMPGGWNIDMSRFAREALPPHVYLSSSYYRKWQLGMEQNLIERGYVGADELAAGRALRPGQPLRRGKFTLESVERVMTRGSFARPAQGPARFKAGDRVRAKNIHPATHTRLPRYARDKVGVVEMCHGCHMYPDSVATDQGDNPQWLYTVVFESRELWGPDADPTLKISIDAFEPYLDPA